MPVTGSCSPQISAAVKMTMSIMQENDYLRADHRRKRHFCDLFDFMQALKLSHFTLLGFFTTVGGCAGGEESERTAAEVPWPYGAYDGEPASDCEDCVERRRTCFFDPKHHTSETVDPSAMQDMSALEHVVLVLMENRSFDHYFSTLDNPNLRPTDVAHDESNPDGRGGEIHRYPETRYCVCSPGHEWSEAHLQFDAGLMDGFVATSNPDGGRAMGYYSSAQLPFYHFLGQRFAISARHFSSLLGPTEPNRLFYYLGTSCGFADDIARNPAIATACGTQRKNIFDLLQSKHVSYRIYDDSNVANLLNILGIELNVPQSIVDFENDAARGDLAPVSIVGASTGALTRSNDDHPDANPQLGQRFLSRIVRALSTPASDTNHWKSPWDSSALIVSYDENGGFYDHVPPPKACNPEPEVDRALARDYPFDQLGFRVPLIVISPWAKRGYVSHYDTDHTSVLRFIEHWKDLPALTKRDANAWPLLDLFDFEQTPLPPPTSDPDWVNATNITLQSCSSTCATGVDPSASG